MNPPRQNDLSSFLKFISNHQLAWHAAIGVKILPSGEEFSLPGNEILRTLPNILKMEKNLTSIRLCAGQEFFSFEFQGKGKQEATPVSDPEELRPDPTIEVEKAELSGEDPPPAEKAKPSRVRPEFGRVEEIRGANPQAENGHIDIAHEIAEAFFNLQLSGNQWRILWVILRQTYGWKKEVDRISISFFERKTKLKRRHIVRALRELVERKIVTKNDTSFITTYGFQKDYTKWEPLPKMTLVSNQKRLPGDGEEPSESETVTKNDTFPKMTLKPLPKLVPTKENKKKLYTPENFEPFYKAYPKKKARRDAEKAWAKLNPSPELTQTILTALEKQKRSEEWQKEGGKYIPYPATWINGRRWEDEVKEAKPSW